jgi:hypothetical protein
MQDGPAGTSLVDWNQTCFVIKAISESDDFQQRLLDWIEYTSSVHPVPSPGDLQ